MTVQLKPLPYSTNALEPHICAATVDLHHGKHEAGYVDRVNRMLADTKLADRSLEEIVAAARDLDNPTLFNNAAQAWNHAFYWSSLHPRSGGPPLGAIAAMIDKDFGGYDTFAQQLQQAAITQFGSGWAWLVLDGARLKITATSNAEIPHGEETPLLVIDVWEHAYYLDYRQRRADYVAATIEHLLNWDVANERLLAADSGRARDLAAVAIGLARGVL